MTISEILRTNPGRHIGYMFHSISDYRHFTVAELRDMGYKEFKRIPNKITAYLERSKIASVFKSDCFRGPDNYYLIVATDGTVFYVDY